MAGIGTTKLANESARCECAIFCRAHARRRRVARTLIALDDGEPEDAKAVRVGFTTLQITRRSLGSTPGTLPKSFDPWGVKRLGVGLGPPRSGHKGTRTHLSLNKDAPISRAAEKAGRIICRPILGGLHHQYTRI